MGERRKISLEEAQKRAAVTGPATEGSMLGSIGAGLFKGTQNLLEPFAKLGDMPRMSGVPVDDRVPAVEETTLRAAAAANPTTFSLASFVPGAVAGYAAGRLPMGSRAVAAPATTTGEMATAAARPGAKAAQAVAQNVPSMSLSELLANKFRGGVDALSGVVSKIPLQSVQALNKLGAGVTSRLGELSPLVPTVAGATRSAQLAPDYQPTTARYEYSIGEAEMEQPTYEYAGIGQAEIEPYEMPEIVITGRPRRSPRREFREIVSQDPVAHSIRMKEDPDYSTRYLRAMKERR